MSKIDEIIEAFQESDFQGTLEMLLDYSEDLPELPERFKKARDKGFNKVPECETPVFIWVEVLENAVKINADVPEESPTVRGFVSMLVDAFDGVSPAEVELAPVDLLNKLRLDQKLGTRRMFGLSAVYRRIKDEIKKADPNIH